MGGTPLIELLATRYPGRDRRELYALVLRGEVSVDGRIVTKPGVRVAAAVELTVGTVPAFVSRGGDKLAAALAAWSLSCSGSVWLDAGCSTGGFTDCLLKHGAARVYSVDVGEAQLAWSLRSDPRVVVMESTNIMDVRPVDFSPAPAFAAVDLSFRSLRGAARHILDLTSEHRGIFLAKPQFEYGEAPAEFDGVVRDQAGALAILEALVADLAREDVVLERVMASPLRGRRGNREALCLLRRGALQRSAAAGIPRDLFRE